jgi:hypothetical protein
MAFHRASGARRQTPAIAASGRRHLLAGVTGIEGGASGLDLREAALSPVDQAGKRPEGRLSQRRQPIFDRKQSDKTVPYVRLPEAEFKAIMLNAGLPEELADLIATSNTAAADGALFDDSHTLSKLIGRKTTPFATTIAEALKA